MASIDFLETECRSEELIAFRIGGSRRCLHPTILPAWSTFPGPRALASRRHTHRRDIRAEVAISKDAQKDKEVEAATASASSLSQRQPNCSAKPL